MIPITCDGFHTNIMLTHGFYRRSDGDYMTHAGFFRADKATRLAAFLSRDPVALKHFPEVYHKDILKRTQRLMKQCGNDLDADLAEDVVQRFWFKLLKSAPDVFHADGGSADGFIKNRLLTAIRDVRATYAPPGQPTRLPKKNSEAAKNRRPAAVSLDAAPPGSENRATLADLYQDPQNEIAAATERVFIDQLLMSIRATGSKEVYQALVLILEDDRSLSNAAKAVNLHHTYLRRSLDSWCHKHPGYFC